MTINQLTIDLLIIRRSLNLSITTVCFSRDKILTLSSSNEICYKLSWKFVVSRRIVITNENDKNVNKRVENVKKKRQKRNKSVILIVIDLLWNAQKINFFDFFYDDKTIVIDDSIIHVDKKIYYKNVHFFVNRIKNMITIKNKKFFRENLWICLRSRALKWWNWIFTKKQ